MKFVFGINNKDYRVYRKLNFINYVVSIIETVRYSIRLYKKYGKLYFEKVEIRYFHEVTE